MSRPKFNLILVFLITLSFHAYFIRPADWNINSRLALVKSIVEERRLSIDSYHEGEFETGDKAYVNGHYYSDKAIGASLLGAIAYSPIYLVLGRPLPTELFLMLITLLAISIPSALIAPLLYSVAFRIMRNEWAALSIALGISLGTPIFPFAGGFYGHSLAAVLAFSVFCLWMGIQHFDVAPKPGHFLLSSFLIGFMVLTEYTTVLIAIVLLGYVIFVMRLKQVPLEWKNLGVFLLGGAIPLILFLSYNWICFGSPLTVGYANENLEEFRSVHSEGVMGIQLPNLRTLLYMTIHPMQGIFVQSPILLMSLWGAVMMYRERKFRMELITIAAILLIYFLAISGLTIWWGGNSFTVRHLIPVLPFFGIFLMFLPRKHDLLLLGTGVISFLQMLIASATIYNPLDQIIRDKLNQGGMVSWNTSLLYQELLPKLLRNRLSLTWGNYLFGIESWYLNLAIPMLAAGALLVTFYIVNRQKQTAPQIRL